MGGRHEGQQGVEAAVEQGARLDDGCGGGGGAHVGEDLLRVVGAIRLVHDDDGLGPAGVNGGDVPLDAAGERSSADGGDDEDAVDVGGDRLGAGATAGLLADEQGGSREEAVDDLGAGGDTQKDPVAGGGRCEAGGSAIGDDDRRERVGQRAEYGERAAIDGGDARWEEIGIGERLEMRLAGLGPPQDTDSKQWSSPPGNAREGANDHRARRRTA